MASIACRSPLLRAGLRCRPLYASAVSRYARLCCRPSPKLAFSLSLLLRATRARETSFPPFPCCAQIARYPLDLDDLDPDNRRSIVYHGCTHAVLKISLPWLLAHGRSMPAILDCYGRPGSSRLPASRNDRRERSRGSRQVRSAPPRPSRAIELPTASAVLVYA
ncbi:hypothetical protein GGS23DRAFT_170940 [Durotheca rogersii]|uniref:uncharacterized protein n=1 Tax=Durotheca rogersii TaxID=419775 RepID=UPI00221FAF74|nr:uncharacterized protein GGS23DRAFT_170940 [Durotheca rogersii]KAI5867319.1 hypothetical protein GGS23DRAFT_170940 [Durotheca rogersii]